MAADVAFGIIGFDLNKLGTIFGTASGMEFTNRLSYSVGPFSESDTSRMFVLSEDMQAVGAYLWRIGDSRYPVPGESKYYALFNQDTQQWDFFPNGKIDE